MNQVFGKSGSSLKRELFLEEAPSILFIDDSPKEFKMAVAQDIIKRRFPKAWLILWKQMRWH